MVRAVNWFNRKRFKWDSEVLKRRGVWGETAETLEFLLDKLSGLHFDKLDVERRKAIKTQSRQPNVDRLLLTLQQAAWYVRDEEPVASDFHPQPLVMTFRLDDFLIDNRGRSVSPDAVVEILKRELLPWLENLQLLYAQNHPQQGYYFRQFNTLFADLRRLMETLIFHSDEFY